jgi:hypothetical protein
MNLLRPGRSRADHRIVAAGRSKARPLHTGRRRSAVAKSLPGLLQGTSALTTGAGGSIPFFAALTERHSGFPVLLTGAEEPDSRAARGANEPVHVGELEKAILAEGLFRARIRRRPENTRRSSPFRPAPH